MGVFRPLKSLELLDAGANPKAKTSDGSIPWDFIQRNDALKETDVYWLLHQARYE